MLRKMVIPGERIAEVESEDTGDTDSVEPYPDICSMGIPGILSSDLCIPSPLHTRAYGKARKTKKDREPYGLPEKLHLLSAELFAGNATVRIGSCIGRVA